MNDWLPTDQMTQNVRENKTIIEENKTLRSQFVTSVRTLGLFVGGVSGLVIASTPPFQDAARNFLINSPDLSAQLIHSIRGLDGHSLVAAAEHTMRALGAGVVGLTFGGLGHMFAEGWSKLTGQGDYNRAMSQTSSEAVLNRRNAEMQERQAQSAKKAEPSQPKLHFKKK